MSRIAHAPSYYAASAHPQPPRPPLQGVVEADVAVLGAGYSGLSAALHLAERGFRVAVLESVRVGWGASGRNGGQLVNSYSRDIDVIQRTYGEDAARALGSMMFEGGDIIRERIARYDIACDYRQGGAFVAHTPRQLAQLRAQQALWARYGNDHMELCEGDALREVVNCDAYAGGLVDPRSGHVHPLNLALGEAAAVERLGGRIYEHSAVTRLARGDTVVLHTASGQLRAKFAVITGNAYLGSVVPELTGKAMPCGTQMIATEVLGEAAGQRLLPAGYCVEDCNYILDYYRMSADHRLLYGSGVTYGGGDPASIERFIRPRLEKTFPSLKGVRFDYSWGGDFLLTLTRLPQLGRLEDNIYYAQGYSGHGVCTSHLAGRLIAEAMGQQAERFDVFAGLPHYPFPGGRAFRVPFTLLGAWYYSLRDRLGL
ncbi:MAG: FAD-binding oxidoreductase [Spongiibacteraceae bacterium]|jgi:gamma-glutamylputrescine oxidase|nr:FAD-binding oxidoreductase [Spongiibacteraceae bacterium]